MSKGTICISAELDATRWSDDDGTFDFDPTVVTFTPLVAESHDAAVLRRAQIRMNLIQDIREKYGNHDITPPSVMTIPRRGWNHKFWEWRVSMSKAAADSAS